MSTPWEPLVTELAAWRRGGQRVPLWLRDDDATAPSPALDRLLSLTVDRAIPLRLAVIPEGATRALANRLQSIPTVRVQVHGWSHRNHEPPDRKKAEFGDARPLDRVLNDARAGLDRLRTLFGDQCEPILVPPWNRCGPGLSRELAPLGYTALSTFGPEPEDSTLPRCNTHLDIIDWRGSRSLVPPERLISQLTALLQNRRRAPTVPLRPVGILTHHLDHDDAIWSFLETLLEHLMDSQGMRWIGPEETPWIC